VVLLATLSHDQLVLIVVSVILLLGLFILSDAAMILKFLLDLRVLQLFARSLLFNLLLARFADRRREVLEIFYLGGRLGRVVFVLDREGILLFLNLALLLQEYLTILALL